MKRACQPMRRSRPACRHRVQPLLVLALLRPLACPNTPLHAYVSTLQVYSFGVTLWELMERKRPFAGYDGFQIQTQVGALRRAARWQARRSLVGVALCTC